MDLKSTTFLESLNPFSIVAGTGQTVAEHLVKVFSDVFIRKILKMTVPVCMMPLLLNITIVTK